MVSSQRLALVLVITVILIEKNKMLLFANAEIPAPKQCTQYTNVKENLRSENGTIFINIKWISSALCAHKQPKSEWYRFRYRLNVPFSLNKDFDVQQKFLGSSENTSCPRNGVPGHPCRVHETKTSKLCFEVSRKIRIGRSVNITNCGSFYVFQLLQLTCKEDTSTLQRWEVDKPRDNNCSIRNRENVRQKRDIKGAYVICNTGWKSFRKSCYKISSAKLSWSDAKKDCDSHGAHLLKIDDRNEQRYFDSLLRNMAVPSLWIGLHASKNARTWQWESDGSYAIYTNWNDDEPNDTGGNEDCVEIYTGKDAGFWNDQPCKDTRKYICQKIGDNFPSTTQKWSSSAIPNTTVKMSPTPPTPQHSTTTKTKPTDRKSNMTPTLLHTTTRKTSVRLSNTTPTFHHNTTRKTTVSLSNTTPTLRHNTTRKTTVRLPNTTPAFHHTPTRNAEKEFAALEKEAR